MNVGQQEALGVKELIKLSNEAIENIVSEVKRNASQRLKGGKDDEILTLVYELLIDASSTRKRLNDYTEVGATRCVCVCWGWGCGAPI